MGFDVHAFAQGRPLVLGGVELPYELGLDGHSDADVLVHAIMDALLGAAALGDIGRHFPPTDPQYKDISSLALLEKVSDLLRSNGLSCGNIDTIVAAEEPKLAPYVDEMQQKIAAALEIDARAVGIKATTTEGLGFTGRKEGIAAWAVALVQ